MQSEKKDPHNSQKYLDAWREKKLNLSRKNAKLLKEYISDMLLGFNVSGSKKGGRSKIKTLASARQLEKLLSLLELHFNVKDVTQLKEKVLLEFFSQLQQGIILNTYGKPYKSVGDYATRFKAFFHWYMKVMKKQGVPVLDITEDLDSSKRKNPPFVYFTVEQLEKMLDKADYETRVFMLFLFDSGIRAPTEALNIRVVDFIENFSQLNIRDGISKTFGRQIKLMMSGDSIKRFVKDNHLSDNDLLFSFNPPAMNKRLKKLGKLVLGDKATKGRKKGSELTMYDFRHASACYWVTRYKSESALKYRFGWKKSTMIHYYTQLLGMKDTITEEDMLLTTSKTELERKVLSLAQELENFKKAFAHHDIIYDSSGKPVNMAKLFSA